MKQSCPVVRHSADVGLGIWNGYMKNTLAYAKVTEKVSKAFFRIE
jgi:hypothetical protein